MKNSFQPDSEFDIAQAQMPLRQDGQDWQAYLVLDWYNQDIDVEYHQRSSNSTSMHEYKGHQNSFNCDFVNAEQLATYINDSLANWAKMRVEYIWGDQGVEWADRDGYDAVITGIQVAVDELEYIDALTGAEWYDDCLEGTIEGLTLAQIPSEAEDAYKEAHSQGVVVDQDEVEAYLVAAWHEAQPEFDD